MLDELVPILKLMLAVDDGEQCRIALAILLQQL